MAKTKILELLDALTDQVEQARRVPFSNKVIVDPDRISALVDNIRMVLPDEIKRVDRTVTEEDPRLMLEEARSLAVEMRAEAEHYARDVLKDLETTLDRVIRVVRRGLEQLEDSSQRKESVQH